MPLDPRHHRLDDLLRRPLAPRDPIELGTTDHTTSGDAWGFPEPFHRGRQSIEQPLILRIRADGNDVVPESGIWRPSHVTRHARCPITELQVVEDRFIAPDRTAVCAVWLRNPTDQNIRVAVQTRWNVPDGEWQRYWSRHSSPAGDDLEGHLAGGARRLFTFTWNIAETDRDARRNTFDWGSRESPVHDLLHDHTVATQADPPRFESDNPWLNRLFAHRIYRKSRELNQPEPPSNPHRPQDDFTDGDYERPSQQAAAWERWIVDILAGIRPDNHVLVLDPLRESEGLRTWCLDNLRTHDHRICIAWDDPAIPEDAFHDGRRGFDVWIDGRHRHHAERPESVCIPWDIPNQDEF